MTMGKTGRVPHVILWVPEILAILLVALLLMLPSSGLGSTGTLRWHLNPSAETWQAFQSKQREEFLVRLGMETPVAILALFLGFRLRSKSRTTTETRCEGKPS